MPTGEVWAIATEIDATTGFPTYSFHEKAPVKDDGSFEFNLPDTYATGVEYTIVVNYIGDDYYKSSFDKDRYLVTYTKSPLNSLKASETEHRC